MHARAAYDELIRRTREQALLASCVELLGWDEETKMPRGGVEHRGGQMALLAGLHHQMATDPRLGDLLANVEASDLVRDPRSDEAANVRELRRSYDRRTRLPRHLVEELARVTSMAQQEWVEARDHGDYGHFRPWLEKILHLKRCEAQSLGYPKDPYDALLEDYEPGARARDLAALFGALRGELVPLVQDLVEAPRRPDVSLLHRDYPVARQQFFAETVAATLGFDFRAGRLDTAPHPFFSSVGPGDCRITTRYQPRHLGTGLFALLHEVGHGLYEQGLPNEHAGTPLGDAPSLALHESQARLWENTVGRGRPFWTHFFPLARNVFREALADVTLDEFHFAVNHVARTPIRVEADEVTYNLHILIRFELERALLSGDLAAADLPDAWNAAYRQTLGVSPANDAEGCLQDGHWASGLVGYFPTYTLGNVFSAQLYDAARAATGDLDDRLARGDFTGLLTWLRTNVHHQGSRYEAATLIEIVTGSPPDPRSLLQGLRRKYGELYRIV